MAKSWQDSVVLRGAGELAPFIHPAAVGEGMVEMEEGSSVWGGAVIRADMNHTRLGRYVNVQDNCVLHVDFRSIPTEIGDYSLVGHQAMIHNAKIGRACLIGIQSVILEGAEIGDGAMITAGCLIRGGTKIPPRALVIQKDGKLIIKEGAARSLMTIVGSLEYAALVQRYRSGEVGTFSKETDAEWKAEAKRIQVELGLK